MPQRTHFIVLPQIRKHLTSVFICVLNTRNGVVCLNISSFLLLIFVEFFFWYLFSYFSRSQAGTINNTYVLLLLYLIVVDCYCLPLSGFTSFFYNMHACTPTYHHHGAAHSYVSMNVEITSTVPIIFYFMSFLAMNSNNSIIIGGGNLQCLNRRLYIYTKKIE